MILYLVLGSQYEDPNYQLASRLKDAGFTGVLGGIHDYYTNRVTTFRNDIVPPSSGLSCYLSPILFGRDMMALMTANPSITKFTDIDGKAWDQVCHANNLFWQMVNRWVVEIRAAGAVAILDGEGYVGGYHTTPCFCTACISYFKKNYMLDDSLPKTWGKNRLRRYFEVQTNRISSLARSCDGLNVDDNLYSVAMNIETPDAYGYYSLPLQESFLSRSSSTTWTERSYNPQTSSDTFSPADVQYGEWLFKTRKAKPGLDYSRWPHDKLVAAIRYLKNLGADPWLYYGSMISDQDWIDFKKLNADVG